MPSSANSTPPPMSSGSHPVYRSAPPGPSVRSAASVPPATTSSRSRQSVRPPPIAPAHRVLVIDDDDMVRRALVRALRRKHAVVELRDAESAIALLASGERFDAILCDMNLEGMSGQDFFLELETFAEDQARRVVIVSGDPTSLDPELFGAHPPRFLEKPAEIMKIEAVLAEVSLVARAA